MCSSLLDTYAVASLKNADLVMQDDLFLPQGAAMYACQHQATVVLPRLLQEASQASLHLCCT